MFFINQTSGAHCVLAVICLLALSNSAFAQNKVPDSLTLNTVVIQATRASAQTPVPHTNFSAQKIAQTLQSQDIPFLLSATPSLVESSDAGAGIGYTGLRIRGSDPTRINVTLNGVPLNDAESQGVFWVNMPDLASSASEIQVQRGVGASTNGAGSFGATVNIDLSKVEAEPSALLNASIGAFDTRKYAIRATTGLLKNRWAFSGRLSTLRSDGFIDRASVDLNAVHLTGTYIDEQQSIQAHLLSGHEITYQAWNGVPAQYIDDPEKRTFNTAGIEQPGLPYPNEVDDYTQRHYLLHYKRQMLYGLSLQINGHYTRGFGFFEQYRSGQILTEYNMPASNIADTSLVISDLVRRRWLDNHFYGATFALRWAPPVNPPGLSGPPTLLWGGAISRYDGVHFGEVIWAQLATSPKGHRYYENDASKTDANSYLKTEIGFSNGWRGFLDLQVRAINYQFRGFNAVLEPTDQQVNFVFFNPKAGFNWKFAQKWSAYGFFGVAHREPNRDDFTQSTPQGRPRPERLLDWELGLKTNSYANWMMTINAFWMQYRDQLVLDGRLNDVGAYIRTNVPDSYRAGVEAELTWRPDSRWECSANATASRNRIRKYVEYRDNWDTGGQDIFEYLDAPLAFSPEWMGRAEVAWYCLPEKNDHTLRLALIGKYIGQQFLDNTGSPNTTLPAYLFSDFRLNYDVICRNGNQLGVVLGVFNLFDARYSSNGWTYRYTSGFDNRPFDPYTRLENGSTYNQTGFFPQAGTHWMLTLNLGF